MERIAGRKRFREKNVTSYTGGGDGLYDEYH
jgi:hypothetical protein